jgi:FkbM family methyltransferase
MKYKFLEIGTSDFATLSRKYPKEKGICVEPVKSLLDAIPNNPNHIKVNVAIHDKDGTASFYKLKDEFLADKEHRTYERGMSCLEGSDNEEKRITNSVRFNRFEKITVPTMSLSSLLTLHEIDSVEILKIDTEGYDAFILQQLVETPLRPHHIKWEYCHHSDELVRETLDLLKDYTIEKQTKNDIYLRKIPKIPSISSLPSEIE